MTVPLYVTIALGVLFAVGTPIAFVLGKKTGRAAEDAERRAAGEAADQVAKKIVAEAEREADAARKQAVLSGKEEVMKAREAWEQEARKRREELGKEEKRVTEREQQVDRKFEMVDGKEKEVARRASELGRREKQLEEKQAELDQLMGEERRRLEQLAGLSAEAAKAELIRRLEDEVRGQAAALDMLTRQLEEAQRRERSAVQENDRR